MKKLLFWGLTGLFFIIGHPGHAQILDRVLNRAINKTQQRLEDKAAEIIADQLTRYLERQIDNYLSDIAREQAVQDSIDRVNRGEKVTTEQVQVRYREILAGMNDASQVADNYSFQIRMDTEVREGDRVTTSAYLLNTEKPIFAIRQEEKQQTSYLVFDLEKDVVVMFSENKKGEKTGQAMPGFLTIATHYGDSAMMAIKIKPTNKTKTIAGYSCKLFVGESEESSFEWYATTELSNLWQEGFYRHAQRFSGQPHMAEWQKIQGLVLESKYTAKDNKEQPVIWSVIAVDKNLALTLTKKDYKFVGLDDGNTEK